MAKKLTKKKVPKYKKGGLVVDPSYLTYENLPCIGCKDGLMAASGMAMEPGPKIPGLANNIQAGGFPERELFPLTQMPQLQYDPRAIISTSQLPAIDTNKAIPKQRTPQPNTSSPGNRANFNPVDALLLGAGIFNNALADNPNRQTVVQPQMAYNPMPYGYGSQAMMEYGGYVMGEDENNTPSAKNGNWIQKAVNPAHKGYCTPMTKSTCTPRRKALAKTFKKMAKNRKKEHGGIIPDPMSNFSPGMYEQGGNVNGGAKVREVGPNFPNTDLFEQWLLYANGGNVNGGAKINKVGPNYPNTDLMEQWLLYANGGNVNGGAKVKTVDAMFPNTDLMEQWLLYKNGGSLSPEKAKEMLRDGTANGKKLTKKQKQYFGMVASGKAALGDVLSGDPTKPTLSPQEDFYQSSAKLSYYKDQLNQKLKAKNPQAFSDYFKGLVDLRRNNNPTGANQYVQDTQYNEYLSPQEVQSTLGDKYNDYLNSIKSVNAYNVSQGQQPLYGTVEGQDDITKLNYGRRFASMQITPSASVYNKERNTRYSRNYTYDPNSNSVNYVETGDQKLRPDYLAQRQTPTIQFKNGGLMYEDGGEIGTMWGGTAELESYNPYDGGTVEFNGPSHDNGGIGMHYNGNPIEVEGGEFASKDGAGNLNIYGNMYIPGSKTKFKAAAGAIANKEKRYDMLKTKGSDLVNEANPANKFGQLKFNAGQVMMEGGQMGQQDLASKKERLAALQREMLDMASAHGLDPFEMSKGKMKKAKGGASIPFMANGGSDPGGNDPTRADRNMNPGNIKYGKFAQKYGAKRDKDGFAIFPNKQVGEKAMRDLLTGKNYSGLSVRQAISKWTDNHPYRYDLGPLTDKNVGDLNEDELSIVLGTMTQGEGTRYGMTPRKVPNTPNNTPRTPQITPRQPFTPYTIPDVPLEPGTTPINPVNPVPPYDQLEVPKDPTRPSNVEPLGLNNVLGEFYALATNQVEPVPAQRYEPQLFTPYQVSFQDRLNANQSVFNAQSRAVGAGNPAALGTLGAQKYAADQQVAADEFRTNQAIANDITNKNIALVNDANLKNLGIADTQMVRQSQARSKTREFNQMILNSLSDKYAKNELENKRLAAYENLYDYRFVPTEDGGQKATYFGPNAMFNYEGRNASGQRPQDVRTISRYDAQGNLKGYAEYDESDLKEQQRLLDMEMKRRKMPMMPLQPLNR